MIEKIERYYLEINSIEELKTKQRPSDNFFLKEADKDTFNLNKFFYKQIGKKHEWVDRLIWQDKNWMDYISDKNLKTFILQNNNDLVADLNLSILKRATKYQKEIIDKNIKENPYIIGDPKQGDSRE